MTKPNHKLTKLMFVSLKISVLRNENNPREREQEEAETMSIRKSMESFYGSYR